VKPRCPRPELLQTAAVAAHVQDCPDCTRRLEELRAAAAALAELGRAERAATPPLAWAALQARLEQPRRVERLPLVAAAAWRGAAELLRPAAATGALAVLAGLAAGTGIAVATGRAARDAEAADTYTVSSLLDDSEAGLAADYLADADSSGAQP
jgi:hypothetical protein